MWLPSPQLTDLSKRLYDETEGLPFFLVEYLAVLAGGSGLEMSAGRCQAACGI